MTKGSRCDKCGEFISDIDAGFSPGLQGMKHGDTCGGTWRIAAEATRKDETMTTLETARKIGLKIGKAIARDVLADDMPRTWTGLDAQDGDQLTAAGIEPNTIEWDEAEDAARQAYAAVMLTSERGS